MSNYSAIVVKLEDVQVHPNADRLKIATAANEPVVIGLEHENGELGIFFPAGTILADEFLMANNLYRKNPVTDEPMGGYFESNRRVRFQKFRGQMSRGIWLPMSSLDYLCLENELLVGQEFDTLEGHELIQKYVVPSSKPQLPGKPRSQKFENFYEIGDTSRIVTNYHRFKIKDVLVITEKLHGTSGRTAYLAYVEKPERNWLKRQLNTILSKFGYNKERQYGYVTGTRRMVLGENSPDDNNYRIAMHEKLKPYLSKGMIVYYEIVGYGIMQTHSPHGISDSKTQKQLIKLYGDEINYTYGVPSGLYDMYIYKIVEHNAQGQPYVYSWDQLVKWCTQRELKHVPVLDTVLYDSSHLPGGGEYVKQYDENGNRLSKEEIHLNAAKAHIKEIIESYCDGPSILDSRHPKEGVVVQTALGPFKHKSDVFCWLEDIRPYEEPEVFEYNEDEGNE